MAGLLKSATYGIRRKLLVSFSAVAILLIVALGAFAARVLGAALTRESVYYVGKVVTQLVNHLDSYVEQMKSTLMSVALSADLPPFLEGEGHTAGERHEVFGRINTTMLSAVSTRPYNDVLLIIKDRRYVLSTDPAGTTGELDVDVLESSAFYRDMLRSPASIRVVDTAGLPIPAPPVAGFALALDARGVLPAIPPDSCFLVVTSRRAFFDDLVHNVADDTVDSLVIVDTEGRVIYSSAEGLEGVPLAGSSRIRMGGRAYLVTPSVSRSTGWTVYFLSSDQRIRATEGRIAAAVYLSVALLSAVMLGLSSLISTRITRPLRHLKELMRRVEGDDLSVRAGPGPNDEVGDLHRSFDAMVGRMDRLVNELMRSRILMREAELYALQQQVNPHFLYNALEAVNSLANQGRYQEIRSMVQKMAGIFRYCMGRGPAELVRFSEELQYVRDYLDIQEMRFRDRVRVSYHVERGVLDLATPKFVLQPLVENALRHGLRDETAGGCLCIGAERRDGDLVITVEDDGKGMSDEQIARLHESLSRATEHTLATPGGIGLHSVQARIRLLSRGDHGLRLEHGLQGGTRVTMSLPAMSAPPVVMP